MDWAKRWSTPSNPSNPVAWACSNNPLHLLKQAALVPFAGEDVIGIPFNHRSGDCSLTAHGIKGDNPARDFQHPQQGWNRRDFIRLILDLALSEDSAICPRPRPHPGDGGLPTVFVI